MIQLEESKRQIPDWSKCKILLGVMQEPVITPCGLTYDKSALDTHMKTNGFYDPITKKKITKESIVPNRNLEGLIQHYLDE